MRGLSFIMSMSSRSSETLLPGNMALLLLLVMLTACAALPQDMSGKMFTFPQESKTAYVRLTTPRQSLSAVTLCLRTFTDLDRGHAPFSLATPGVANAFVIFGSAKDNEVTMSVRNKEVRFRELGYKTNTWHSFCSTWDSGSGVGQIWLDGKPSSRKYINSGSNITGLINIVLGQDQDEHGGRFNAKQSFVGMMSDVHMWDYTLSPC
ncbi:C-reactive protein-like [Xyrichtys novacula]|uniref:Pentraxin family member n=1 Tax=Xyrichtys novacula TaxID=13765 RepID=A0AAV1G5A0_XYRNO|nr:C-reactive protein-like [Xyrichtys novacula]